MTDRYSLDDIREFWTNQALQHGQSSNASWSDRMVIELEIQELCKHIVDGDRVLDIGCANGYSTVQLALNRRVSILGLDYVPEMIREARARVAADLGIKADKVSFDLGDITALNQPAGTFDTVVVARVLINLGSWERQQKGLGEALRMLGRRQLLLSEAMLQDGIDSTPSGGSGNYRIFRCRPLTNILIKIRHRGRW
jgi:ubiquinone/menaquinone biosynthesis C-methylase UbiE